MLIGDTFSGFIQRPLKRLAQFCKVSPVYDLSAFMCTAIADANR